MLVEKPSISYINTTVWFTCSQGNTWDVVDMENILLIMHYIIYLYLLIYTISISSIDSILHLTSKITLVILISLIYLLSCIIYDYILLIFGMYVYI